MIEHGHAIPDALIAHSQHHPRVDIYQKQGQLSTQHHDNDTPYLGWAASLASLGLISKDFSALR